MRPRHVVQRIHLVDNWNDHINYQRIRNQDLRDHGESLIDDQGVAFEGREGVTPVDDMRRQFTAWTAEPDRGLGGSDDSSGHYKRREPSRCNNDSGDRDCRNNN